MKDTTFFPDVQIFLAIYIVFYIFNMLIMNMKLVVNNLKHKPELLI